MWDSVGEEILIDHDNPLYPIGEKKRILEEIIMVVRAPRGTMTLFRQRTINYYDGTHLSVRQSNQCKAIKAFMEQHNA